MRCSNGPLDMCIDSILCLSSLSSHQVCVLDVTGSKNIRNGGNGSCGAVLQKAFLVPLHHQIKTFVAKLLRSEHVQHSQMHHYIVQGRYHDDLLAQSQVLLMVTGIADTHLLSRYSALHKVITEQRIAAADNNTKQTTSENTITSAKQAQALIRPRGPLLARWTPACNFYEQGVPDPLHTSGMFPGTGLPSVPVCRGH
jgi:hypothetical protein